MKKILIIYYTQSGLQLSILQSLAKPLIDAGHSVHFEEIQPEEKFPFPWSAFQFFNAFPETFSQKPLALKRVSEKAFDNYDLVILGYQPWFLTPSRPVSSLLQSDDGKRILTGKPVVTILGCRNMWLGAQEKVKQRLLDAKAKLVGHVAMVDRSGNLTSLITILRWMFTGNRKPFWFFPQAGVSNQDVEHAEMFGRLINEHITSNNFDTLQSELLKEGAIDIKPNLVLMERRGQKAFSVWSKFIASGGAVHSTGRKIRVYIFMYLLPTAIFFLSPLLWLLSKILLTVKRKELLMDVEYFKHISLRNK
jgi:flavodoxin